MHYNDSNCASFELKPHFFAGVVEGFNGINNLLYWQKNIFYSFTLSNYIVEYTNGDGEERWHH